MSQNYLTNLLFLLPLIVFLGCEDYISFTDEVTLPDAELPASDKFALSAILTTADTVLYLRTDRSISFQQGYRIDLPAGQLSWPTVDEEDLSIRIRSDGGLVTTFRHIPENERFASRDIFDPQPWTGPVYPSSANYLAPVAGTALQPQQAYTLEVDHPRLGDYTIEQRMPRAVRSVSARVSEVQLNSDESPFRTVSLSFLDPADEENYFIIQAATDSLGGNTLLTLNDTDPRTAEGERLREVLFLSDAGADGQVISLDFTAFVLQDYPVSAITVTSVSEGWYRFMESYQRYFEIRQDLDDGITEPFQLYSNVPEGFGYFGLGNPVIFRP